MSRHFMVLYSATSRARAIDYIMQAPPETRVEFKAARRTLPQNDKMWAMLTDIAAQKEHGDRKYTPDQWKAIFMHACCREVTKFIPTLDGEGIIPWGQSSRELSKEEMADLITFIQAWGDENGVQFHDREAPSAA